MSPTRGLLLALLLAPAAQAQVTLLGSLGNGGAQGNGTSLYPALSADGRYLAFVSAASNLVAGDTNNRLDVFVRDLVAGTTERVSVATSGAEGNDDSDFPALSADGRYAAFRSLASDLVAGDTNACADIFVRDRLAGTTVRVNLGPGGVEANEASDQPGFSADGLLLVFSSRASNLVPGDTNLRDDAFLRDMLAGTTVRISVSTAGAQGNSGSDEAVLSADGRYVAFDSEASNLAPGDTNSCEDVYLRDLLLGTTERVTLSSTGAQITTPAGQPSISADGRFVTFYCAAPGIVPGDTNGVGDVFVRDRLAATTERLSISSAGGEADFGSIYSSISADGRFASFMSIATNLVSGDTNGYTDIFVRDRLAGTTRRVSISTQGAQADLPSFFNVISADGRWVAFESDASTLVASDTNSAGDVFVHDLFPGGISSNTCEPGSGGVIPCPCANPPSGPGRGCDNSSSTGGATLAASGAAYLSNDSVVFTTGGEKPTATSILLQGDGALFPGLAFGQGVRCVGGTLKRLYTKTAVAGSILAPDFAAGDLPVSVRTAQVGAPIAPGSVRFYLVYYRDPIVLGGCLSTSTFNATQSLGGLWMP